MESSLDFKYLVRRPRNNYLKMGNEISTAAGAVATTATGIAAGVTFGQVKNFMKLRFSAIVLTYVLAWYAVSTKLNEYS